MKTVTFYETESNDVLMLTLNSFPKGPLAIIWWNKGQVRFISKEKVSNALDTLKDMAAHSGPDTNGIAKFFWDDASLTITL
jgi:hypothetical protein